MSNYRNRKLLDLAHRVTECQLCGCATPDGCEPAHANWADYGKGMGIKAHDVFAAGLCHGCHAELDQGKTWTREQKREFWERAFRNTMLLYWCNGWLDVRA